MKKIFLVLVIFFGLQVFSGIASANRDWTECVNGQGVVHVETSGGECSYNPHPHDCSPKIKDYAGSPANCSQGTSVTIHHFTVACPVCTPPCTPCTAISGYNNWSACVSHNQNGTNPTYGPNVCNCGANASSTKSCNAKPTAPTLSSTTVNCDKGVSCGTFSISGASQDIDIDAAGIEIDTLTYKIDWNGDGIADENFSNTPVASRQLPSPNGLSHSWGNAGGYSVRAQACDNYGLCSDWSNTIAIKVLQCGGNNISDAVPCTDPTDKVGLSQYVSIYPSMLIGSSVTRILMPNCSDGNTKCKLRCDNQTHTTCGSGISYVYVPGSPSSCRPCVPNCCEETTCIGQTCDNGCDGVMVSGEKECRQENWIEQSPE